MDQSILVLNAGSSSIKFQMFDAGAIDLRQTLKGQMEGIGTKPHLVAKDVDELAKRLDEYPIPNCRDAHQRL